MTFDFIIISLGILLVPVLIFLIPACVLRSSTLFALSIIGVIADGIMFIIYGVIG